MARKSANEYLEATTTEILVEQGITVSDIQQDGDGIAIQLLLTLPQKTEYPFCIHISGKDGFTTAFERYADRFDADDLVKSWIMDDTQSMPISALVNEAMAIQLMLLRTARILGDIEEGKHIEVFREPDDIVNILDKTTVDILNENAIDITRIKESGYLTQVSCKLHCPYGDDYEFSVAYCTDFAASFGGCANDFDKDQYVVDYILEHARGGRIELSIKELISDADEIKGTLDKVARLFEKEQEKARLSAHKGDLLER